MSFFEPSPVLLTYIFVQKFVYFEVLALLALLRLFVGRGIARLPALLTLLICLAAILATFAPALNLQAHPLYRWIIPIMTYQNGAALPPATSLVFATSWALRQRRWRWIDALHIIGVMAFFGLWLATKV